MKRRVSHFQRSNHYKNEKYLVILLFLILAGLFLIFMFGFKSGNAIVGFDNFKVGDKAGGNVAINIEKGDYVDADTPVFLAITKGNNTLISKSVTFEEFIGFSRNKILPVEKDGKRFFEDEGSYSVNLGDLIDYRFTETGKYEIIFSIPTFDLTEVKSFSVN